MTRPIPPRKKQNLLPPKRNEGESVILKKDDTETVIIDGLAPDNSIKSQPTYASPNTVGVSLGATINIGSYQSVRVDVWSTDVIQPNESRSEAIDRLSDELAVKLTQLGKTIEESV